MVSVVYLMSIFEVSFGAQIQINQEDLRNITRSWLYVSKERRISQLKTIIRLAYHNLERLKNVNRKELGRLNITKRISYKKKTEESYRNFFKNSFEGPFFISENMLKLEKECYDRLPNLFGDSFDQIIRSRL